MDEKSKCKVVAVGKSWLGADGVRRRVVQCVPTWPQECACEVCTPTQEREGCECCNVAQIEEALNGRR